MSSKSWNLAYDPDTQGVLSRLWDFNQATNSTIIWLDTLLIPTYASIFSLLVLLYHLAKSYRSSRKPTSNGPSEEDELSQTGLQLVESGDESGQTINGRDRKPGFFQLLGCVCLLIHSAVSGLLNKREVPRELYGTSTLQVSEVTKGLLPSVSDNELPAHALCLFYFYTTLLAIVAITGTMPWSRRASRHLAVLFSVTLGVYLYRDLFPLATYTWKPLDLYEGWFLWAKILLVFLIGVAVPLATPQPYVPVDAKHPSPNPSPEQTASLFSLVTYSFLDPIIWSAYRDPKLHKDQLLPPLADEDHASVLKSKGFPYLDTFYNTSRRHIVFGILHIFAKDYLVMALMTVVRVSLAFASPLAINRVLRYLEIGSGDAFIRPWFWISLLLVGPLLTSLSFQWYIYLGNRILARAESILTQLVFEHALRIRIKASSATNKATQSPQALLRSKPGESAQNLVGKINNLVTTDLANITASNDFLVPIIEFPIQVFLCILFLYANLGWSAFVGLATMIVLLPLPGYITKRVQSVQRTRLKKSDARVQSITEVMNVIRMVKFFGWERKMNDRVAEKREEELTWIWKRLLLNLANTISNTIIPIFTMMATYSTYGYLILDHLKLIIDLFSSTIIMKQQLTASVVFSSMSVFDLFRDRLQFILSISTQVMTGKVSLDRVNDFLHNTELLDSFSDEEPELVEGETEEHNDKIGFKDATFAWSRDTTSADGTFTPSTRDFRFRVEGKVLFKQGCVNLVVGPTGSGKTSLLMALLGEMHYIPSAPDSWYNLPRAGGIAYAAQESWVQNETIRDNILFGSPCNEVRYNEVIHQCALEKDLRLFEAGDQTEVGEKGLTLSGGQKARVTLARAVYSQARTLLLDDVFAALDVHTTQWIIKKCFSGDLLQGRTVLLVTHNIALVLPITQYVISLSIDGRVISADPISDELVKQYAAQDKLEMMNSDPHDFKDDQPPLEVGLKTDGKLIVAEEIEEDHLGWNAFKVYLSALSGNHPLTFFTVFVLGLALTKVLNTLQTWYLGYWASQYQRRSPVEVDAFHYLGFYGLLTGLSCITLSGAFIMYIFGAIRASKELHKQLVEAVLGTTLRWLDTTPVSRIITRCTQDIHAVDGPIPLDLWSLSDRTLNMLAKFTAVLIFTPVFLIPGVLVAGVGGWIGRMYIAAQLAVKREASNAKAPVLGHVGAALSGLTSIRAYGAQSWFIEELLNRSNRYTLARMTFFNLNRWICIRIDAVGSLFSSALAIYLVYFQDQNASNTGFTLNMAVGFSSTILWWIRVFNSLEVQGNSLERIQSYISIEQEPKPTCDGEPPAYWPSSGGLQVEKLSARYSPDGPKVLHDLSFKVNSGERIGVVGRTGSGKSSLALSLLRCIFTEGEMYYDGLKTDSINLDTLRSKITIIPQVPELLSGSLRYNLDPFGQYDDAILNDALQASGLFDLQSEPDENRITLDSSISSGGANLSVGQRQILALARAIVRGSKLLILDEATSAIDFKTDAVIQLSLRELKGSATLIIIAHRLHTVIDADRIMVLDTGRIVEFGSPQKLLQNDKGKLRALVDESGDRAALYSMAGL